MYCILRLGKSNGEIITLSLLQLHAESFTDVLRTYRGRTIHTAELEAVGSFNKS